MPATPEREFKYLVFAEKLSRMDADLATFVGAALGMVLESRLGAAIFLDLRDQRRELLLSRRAEALSIDEKEWLEKQIGSFLNGQRDHLMLGEMI